MTLLIFIIILAILVLIHEFGHFIAAKKSGVLVEEFAFGFPPRIFSVKIGETEYSLNLLPIGGYVKVYGEEYHEEKGMADMKLKNRAFIYKKPWQKAVIIVAGVIMNILLGAGIYYFLLSSNNFTSEPFTMFKPYDFTFGSQKNQVIVGAVVDKSPAAKAGMKFGDIIEEATLADEQGQSIQIKESKNLIEYISKGENKKVVLKTKNLETGKVKSVTVEPKFNEKLKRAVIGVNLADIASISYTTPTEKVFSGFMHSYNVVSYSASVMKYFVSTAVKEKSLEPVSDTVSGPVGIYSVVSDVVNAKDGRFFYNLLNIIALLSLSLATINILPFPALDGGRMVFVVYEWLTGKRANEKIERYVNLVGIIVLLSLTVVVTINDIMKFFR